MDVSDLVRIEEGVIKAATNATFNPNINFTAGSEGQLHVGTGNARANMAQGRSKNTKNLPRVTKQKMQRQTKANAGEIIESSGGLRHLFTIPLKNFHLFKITGSIINFCFKKISN